MPTRSKWFVKRGNKVYGPFDLVQLKAKTASILPDDTFGKSQNGPFLNQQEFIREVAASTARAKQASKTPQVVGSQRSRNVEHFFRDFCVGVPIVLVGLAIVTGGLMDAVGILFISVVCTLGAGLLFWLPLCWFVGWLAMRLVGSFSTSPISLLEE